MAGGQRAIADKPKRNIIPKAGPVASPAFFVRAIRSALGPDHKNAKKEQFFYVQIPKSIVIITGIIQFFRSRFGLSRAFRPEIR